MLKWGIDQPIVVDEKGVILKGHGRRLAAFRAGITKVPVVVMRGLSDDDKRGLRIADNQVALLSGWEPELIKFEITELQSHGFEVPLLGFSEKELMKFTSDGGGPQPAADFKAMFQVLIECESEAEQLRVIEKLTKDGIKCRALIA